jgi:hypothetical protein
MQSTDFSEMGLPIEPLLNRRLQFDEATETLVLFGTPQRKTALAQLYFRKLKDSRYVSVLAYVGKHFPNCAGDLFVSAWTLGCNSRLHFLVGEVEFQAGVRVNPVRDHGLVTLDLKTNDSSVWRVYDQEPTWIITEILGSSCEGVLCAIVGFRSDSGIGPVSYHLCRIDLASRSIEKLGSTETPWF